jgi:hypothetical protein
VAVLAVTVLVLGAVLGLSALGNRAESAGAAPVLTADQLRSLPPLSVLAHRPTEAQQRVALAKRQLTMSCMTALGLRYDPPVPTLRDDVVRPFGAEPGGAQPADPGPGEQKPGADADRVNRGLYGPPGERITVRGGELAVDIPQHGCDADAERRLLGDARSRWTELKIRLFEAEQRVRADLEKDATFAAAQQRWRQCMASAGHPAGDPVALLNSVPGGNGTAPAAIRADVDCKSRVRYLDTGYRRLAALQSAWMAANRDLVRERQSLLSTQDAVARQVLGR